MIKLDVRKLTGAEVDLIEDTLNEQLANRLGDRIVTFQDVLDEMNATSDKPRPASAVRVPMGKIVRTLELVHLRRTNPAATWADTGKDPLFAGDADTATEGGAWTPPSAEPTA